MMVKMYCALKSWSPRIGASVGGAVLPGVEGDLVVAAPVGLPVDDKDASGGGSSESGDNAPGVEGRGGDEAEVEAVAPWRPPAGGEAGVEAGGGLLGPGGLRTSPSPFSVFDTLGVLSVFGRPGMLDVTDGLGVVDAPGMFDCPERTGVPEEPGGGLSVSCTSGMFETPGRLGVPLGSGGLSVSGETGVFVTCGTIVLSAPGVTGASDLGGG